MVSRLFLERGGADEHPLKLLLRFLSHFHFFFRKLSMGELYDAIVGICSQTRDVNMHDPENPWDSSQDPP